MTRGQKAWATRIRNEEKARLEHEEKMMAEARRVAAALTCSQWWEFNGSQFERRFRGTAEDGQKVFWWIAYRPALACIGFGEVRPVLHRETLGKIGPWRLGKQLPGEQANLIARALYCLSTPESVLLELKLSFSAHEKMEARLTFPREFWPLKWITELEEQAKPQTSSRKGTKQGKTTT